MADKKSGTIVQVDPTTLTISSNVRTETTVDDEFVNSIKAHGVLQPPVVTDNGNGGYEIVLGHRRTLGAIKAGLSIIDAYLVTRDEAEAARVVDQLTENEQRQQLTNAERLGGYKRLALLNLTPAQIASRTTTSRKIVDAALAIGDHENVTAAIAQYDIDLVTAAAIAEFADDSKTTAALVDKARTGRDISYDLTAARRAVSLKQSKAELKEQLKTDGITIVKEANFNTYGGNDQPGARLSVLRTDKDKEITPSAHKKCPGHAAFITAGYYAEKAEIIYVCTDWKANAHQKSGNRVLTPEEIAVQEERTRRAAELAEQLEITRELRMTFLRNLILRNKPATLPGADRLIALAVTGHARRIVDQAYGYYNSTKFPVDLMLEILSIDTSDIEDLHAHVRSIVESHPQPATMTLVYALATFEHIIRSTGSSEAVARSKKLWIETLTNWGHNLTQLEQEVLTSANNIIALAEAEQAAAAAEPSEEAEPVDADEEDEYDDEQADS